LKFDMFRNSNVITTNNVCNCLGGQQLERLSLDELDELEDEEDEKVILEYRKKRIAEMKAAAAKARFGEVREISAEDYVEHVQRAGEGVWVVLHLFKQG